MKKLGLLVLAAIPTLIIAGCTTGGKEYNCPAGSEYRENTYEDGTLESQGCFKIESDVMEGHWIYYFENGGKDMEGDIVDDLAQGVWKFYDEEGNNVVVMEGTYKDDEEDGKWTYYDDDGEYICAETYSKGELVDRGDCVYDENYDEKDDIE